MAIFWPHARKRMAERKITEEEVLGALKRRTGVPRPGDSGKIVVFGYGRGSRILKVVLTADELEIVSVMALGE
ncbi:MAG TPA: DUF4258 domain-containing protein [Trebonia sp.]|jgi:hypothetical protein|nr:DUF4258 domain-containing protein [Trebonia sp.]